LIFKGDSIDLILRGEKTQTRRPVKATDRKRIIDGFEGVAYMWGTGWRWKWRIGHTYAIQPGRGKKAVGRFRLTGIRCERVADVSDVDAALEGIAYRRGSLTYGSTKLEGKTASEAYLNLWQRIYPKSDLTEMAWILEFEVEA